MSPNLETFLANVRKVIRDGGVAEIGGGQFNRAELRDVNNEILYLVGRCDQLEHDQKLLLTALEGLLKDKYLADPINADRMKQANAAYRHVTGCTTGGTNPPGQPHPIAVEELERLVALADKERTARIAAQTENEKLKSKLAASGVEQRRAVHAAVMAEVEACSKTRSAKPRTLPRLGSIAAQRCYEKGWKEGVAALRKAIRARGAA